MFGTDGSKRAGRANHDSRGSSILRGPHTGLGSTRARPSRGGSAPRDGGAPPLRILFIITRADSIGGAQIHVRDLTRFLAEEGHRVAVASGVGASYTATLGRSGVEAVQCPALRREIRPLEDLRAYKDLAGIIERYRPDLVSTHTSKAGFLGRLACKSLGIPCLFTAHGWSFSPGVPGPRRAAYRYLERLAAPLADRIICVSEHDRRLAIGAGIPSDQLVTIHNGMPDIPGSLRAHPGAPGPARIVMIARCDEQKDHETILRAIAGIEGARLDFVGGGPTLPRMSELAARLGVSGRVRFLGHREDVADILAGAHVFALISKWEGFPRSTLEAMRAGLPVVVSDVGGASEAVEEGVTGYCVPRGDVAAVRSRLAALVHDAPRRVRMGQAGRTLYEDRFMFSHMFEATSKIYRSVVERGRTRCPTRIRVASPVG
jgi:glycosyltransferase involved in cell wall biosynthesis